MKNAISRMLAAIKVECMDEFDRNFDTESFCGRANSAKPSPTITHIPSSGAEIATSRREKYRCFHS